MSLRPSRIALGCLVFVMAGMALFVFEARKFIFPEQLNVVSIKTLPEYQDRGLLVQGFETPNGLKYNSIVFQPNGSLCGPTSVANVVRSAGTNTHEMPADVLRGTELCKVGGICWGGLAPEQVGALVKKEIPNAEVSILRDISLEQFRDELTHANDANRRYIVNFDRGPLFGTRGGHFSPVVSYFANRDLVLVLDVNAKYKPWLVHTDRLFEAFNTGDSTTGLKRALIRIELPQH